MKSKIDRFIRDKHGKIVMWQFPNVWLIGWAACRLAAPFASGSVQRTLGYLGTGFLLMWAILEIAQGASYFRRALGTVVLLVTVMSVIFS